MADAFPKVIIHIQCDEIGELELTYLYSKWSGYSMPEVPFNPVMTKCMQQHNTGDTLPEQTCTSCNGILT